jgi:hypothetical protein
VKTDSRTKKARLEAKELRYLNRAYHVLLDMVDYRPTAVVAEPAVAALRKVLDHFVEDSLPAEEDDLPEYRRTKPLIPADDALVKTRATS